MKLATKLLMVALLACSVGAVQAVKDAPSTPPRPTRSVNPDFAPHAGTSHYTSFSHLQSRLEALSKHITTNPAGISNETLTALSSIQRDTIFAQGSGRITTQEAALILGTYQKLNTHCMQVLLNR